ncbi:MAG: transposase [Actinomycetales bacterium]|nr:transposase [Actinomycetales bacterium]
MRWFEHEGARLDRWEGTPAGGRPPAFDAEDYKGRNVVERSFNDQKQWRGIATRYDKLAITYRGGVVLRAITIWLKALGDTP